MISNSEHPVSEFVSFLHQVNDMYSVRIYLDSKIWTTCLNWQRYKISKLPIQIQQYSKKSIFFENGKFKEGKGKSNTVWLGAIRRIQEFSSIQGVPFKKYKFSSFQRHNSPCLIKIIFKIWPAAVYIYGQEIVSLAYSAFL